VSDPASIVLAGTQFAQTDQSLLEIILVIMNRPAAPGIAVLSILVLTISAQPFAAGQTASNDSVRMNQIQVIGSHNSYHAGIAPGEVKLMMENNPKRYQALEYRHRPLDQQLDSGVRQIELDIYADSQGGRFADPLGPKLVAQAGLPADPPFDPNGIMKKPGFKLMHVQDFDYRSTCQPFTACLEVVRKWSHAHPGHLPIYILVETKQNDLPAQFHATTTEKFTSATFDALDAEIRSVFSARKLITPDDVRGKHATIEDAVLNNGWPALDKARGKIVFLLDQEPVGPVYLEGHPALRGRVIFTNAKPGEPDCALSKRTMARGRRSLLLSARAILCARAPMRTPKRLKPTAQCNGNLLWPAERSFSAQITLHPNPRRGPDIS
jgi:Phosphoinositide phospholipase C, Ca2+-dependent